MLSLIKSKIYSSILYLGALYHKDQHSKVIYYHDIHDESNAKYTEMSTDFNLFKVHIQCIKEMRFEIVKDITQPEKQLKISFDDGFRGVYHHKDYFVQNQIFPTIYIITSLVGEKDYLTWEELRELDSLGFNLQSHTHFHSDLNKLDKKNLFDDLKKSKNLLEKNLNREITELCFPKGLFNNQVLEVAKEVGYTKCYCSIPGNSEDHKELEILYYRNLVQFSSKRDFKSILLGGMLLFKNRYKKQHYA